MKLSTQEEYGIRCLLQIGRREQLTGEGLTIPEISQAEGLSGPSVAKTMRNLRLGDFVTSVRGQAGGYRLSRPAEEIVMGEVIAFLGGPLFGPDFCDDRGGGHDNCAHSVACSIRSLWNTVQFVIDQILGRITLRDLLGDEEQLEAGLRGLAEDLLQISGPEAPAPVTQN